MSRISGRPFFTKVVLGCTPGILFRAWIPGLLLVLAGHPGSADETSFFVDVAESAGVAVPHATRSFENPYAEIMEGYTALGASASVADIDGDGREDVFVTDSSKTGRNLLWRNVTERDASGQVGDLRFVDVAESAGVAAGNDAANASANSLFFDMDEDGDPDLLVIRFGQNRLFENVTEDGEIRFRDVTKGSGMERYLNCIAAIAFDHDLDGDLDLFLANYFSPVDLFDPDTPRFFPESFETAENGGGVTVYRNDGGGRFTDVTEASGLGAFSGWSLDLGHADVDHDGDDDLYVAADFGTDRFYRNDGDGTFTDLTVEVFGLDTKKGMNADWGDFDGDGLFDLYVTNITDEYMQEGNFLWQNLTADGEIAFADVARETGTHNTGWGWAGKFFDYDNDGLLDLFVVNGWVSGNESNYVLDIFELITRPDVDLADARKWPPMGDKTLSGYQHNVLFHNEGGLFVDRAARHGVDSLLDGRGVAVADFDRDGRLDLFVTNSGKAPFLYRNVMPRTDGAPHWLQLHLVGTASNRSAVGARVRVDSAGRSSAGRSRWSFVNGGNGFASQSSRVLHFGLGDSAEPVRVEVHWPSGAVQTLEDVAVDHRHELTEPDGAAGLDGAGLDGDGLDGDDIEERLWRHRNLGKAFYENSATQYQAVEEFEKALGLAPDSARERVNYGLALLRAGQEEKGIAQLEQAQAQDPSIPHTWFNLGIAYKRAARYDQARAQLEQMAELVPGEPVTRYNLGVLYKLAGETSKAITQFERAAALDPNMTGPHFQLATSYRQAGEAEKAKQAMDRFRALKRRSAGSAVSEDLEWSWYSEIYDTPYPVESVWDPPPADDPATELARSLDGSLAESAGQSVRYGARGDFDDDGDLDLVVVGDGAASLWQADGDVYSATETSWPGDFRVAAWLDYDHDYDLDLFLLGADQMLLRNQGEAGWLDVSEDFPFRDGTAVAVARLDVMADSQGMDLAVSYEAGPGVLYRDRLGGRYEAVEMPDLPSGARELRAADLNRDGWTDLVARNGSSTFLLNTADPMGEGAFEVIPRPASEPSLGLDGASGPELVVELQGVKNLKAAQGSEVEVKAGTFYRKKLYDGVPLAFELPPGTELVDTVRITWPNGLIQNESQQTPGRHVYEEAQRLSGSCPMIFTWNGDEFTFVTDVLGVAPLGAAAGDGPDGREYFPVDHDEVIQIRGDQLVPSRDSSGRLVYEMRITEELREVAFLDEIRLEAVDHPADLDVFVNSKFKGPPFPPHRLFAASRPGSGGEFRRGEFRSVEPRRALDHHGVDVTDRVLALDQTYPDGFRRGYDGTAETHWLELDFGSAPDVAADGEAILVLSGWVDWADGSTFLGVSQESEAGLVMPYLQVRDEAGQWTTVIDDMGLPAGKPKTIVVDLTDSFLSADRGVRIVTNLALYWDRALLAESAAEPDVVRSPLPALDAELRFRGFARPVIHPRRLQPESFVYADVRPWTMWNPTRGLYTRYGDVEPLLRRVDDRMVIMGSGDEIALRFAADDLPELAPGMARSFLLFVDGWAKDGDANTAHSQTVGPLPFHAMPRYPYDGLAEYPDDPELRLWQEHYNQRPALRLIRPLSPTAPAAGGSIEVPRRSSTRE